MKKILLLFVLFLCVTISFSQSLLWKVTGNDLKGTSYLYGSIHIQDARVFAFDSTIVLGALQSCDAFAMEVLLDEIDPQELRQGIYMKKGKLLSNILKPNDFNKLDSLCKVTLGVSAYLVNTMKPFFLSSAIQQAMMPKEQAEALDLYLLKYARNAQKKCFGVEEYSTQIAAIDALTLKEQLKMLQNVLDEVSNPTDTAKTEFDELLQAYLEADYDKMFQLSSETSMSKKFNKVFLYDRNIGMANSFVELAKRQTLFCTVGAGHLGCAKGVIDLLRKKGYQVEPVPFEWIK